MSFDARAPDLPDGYSAPILRDVVAEHLDEVTFLSIQRRKLLFSPDVPLSGLRRHDDRIAAHWDGLVVGRPVSLELAWERMAGSDPWDVYAAARVWMDLGDPALESVRERLEKADEGAVPGWGEAFRRTSSNRLRSLFPEGPTGSEPPRILGLLVDAWGWHGMLPESRLPRFAKSADRFVRRSLARSLGWIRGSATTDAVLDALLADPDKDVSRAAFWSEVLHRPGAAADKCRAALRAGTADPFTVRNLGLFGGAEDAAALASLLDDDDVAPAVARALGDLGSASSVDLLIGLLEREDEALRRAAADALETILGELPDPERKRPPEDLPPAEETPDPEWLRTWWLKAGAVYAWRMRWLRGNPFPWEGAPELEPMEARWRSAVTTSGKGDEWLRREVPDGFFTARPDVEAQAGE